MYKRSGFRLSYCAKRKNIHFYYLSATVATFFFFFVESEMLKLMVMASGELVYSSPLKGEENKANEIS